ncbi:MAG: hypothetical protein OXH00_26060 [Candidatus Poribacteria bacterium]|nr:hypothetical protein [Candidatus Poribacteria bacterium]
MKLKDRLMNLSSIESQWGIWADAPFTADSDSRVGQTQFENGGLLDDKEFVGTLDSFNFEVCEISLGWSEIRDGAAYGIDSVIISGDPHISAENLVDMIESNIDEDAAVIVSVDEVAAWLDDDDKEGCNLDVAEAGDCVWHLSFEDLDVQQQVEDAIDEAEENRLERIRLSA